FRDPLLADRSQVLGPRSTLPPGEEQTYQRRKKAAGEQRKFDYGCMEAEHPTSRRGTPAQALSTECGRLWPAGTHVRLHRGKPRAADEATADPLQADGRTPMQTESFGTGLRAQRE